MNDNSVDVPNTNSKSPEIRHVIATFSGPLPPPQVLEEYNRIVARSAERILVMAEKQAEHRRHLESQAMSSNIGNSRIGLFCGLLIALAGLVAATIIAVKGNPQAGVGVGFLTLGSLAGVFVYSTRLQFKGYHEDGTIKREAQ